LARFERVDLLASSVSAALAGEFDEFDSFIDEDEIDALARTSFTYFHRVVEANLGGAFCFLALRGGL